MKCIACAIGGVITVAALIGVCWFLHGYVANHKAMKKTIADQTSTIDQLKAAATVYSAPASSLDVAASQGLTDQPGWQLQKILEHAGDGSVFFQLEASTRKDGNISTVGPNGFSWRSTTNDALAAAKLRRQGGAEKSESTTAPK